MINWAPSSEFVSSSIPSWQILTAHAQPFREARDLAFCLKVPLDLLLVWASSGGSGETARMRRLAWTFAARIGDKYQIRLTRSNWKQFISVMRWNHVIQFAIILSHLTSLKMYMYFINIMNKYSKLFNNGETIYEPPHDKKPTKWHVHPAKIPVSLGIRWAHSHFDGFVMLRLILIIPISHRGNSSVWNRPFQTPTYIVKRGFERVK